MDINKLRIFKCVADLGGISVASSELKMRQSSISTALSSLESELGYKVLQRHYRGMSLTKKGERLYKYAKKTLEDFEFFLNSAVKEDSEDAIEGVLTVATSFGISASDWFIKKLTLTMDKYPDLKIRIIHYRDGDLDKISADVFICPYIENRSELIQESIEAFTFRLFASKDYIEKFGLPKAPEDLDDHRLISFSKILHNPFDDVDTLLHKGRDPNEERYTCLEINNSISLIKIVKEGYGLGSIPVEEGISEGLIPLLGVTDVINKTTCFTIHNRDSKNKNILAFKNIFLNN